MTADLLREAAALMRGRAKAATWTVTSWGVDEIGAVWAEEADGQPVLVSRGSSDMDAEHIASWHPAVALAVADWLDEAAEEHDGIAKVYAETLGRDRPAWALEGPALAVARAYLGRES